MFAFVDRMKRPELAHDRDGAMATPTGHRVRNK
jgi:hypothetical protein